MPRPGDNQGRNLNAGEIIRPHGARRGMLCGAHRVSPEPMNVIAAEGDWTQARWSRSGKTASTKINIWRIGSQIGKHEPEILLDIS
jgi:hypothetical protein